MDLPGFGEIIKEQICVHPLLWLYYGRAFKTYTSSFEIRKRPFSKLKARAGYSMKRSFTTEQIGCEKGEKGQEKGVK